MKIGKVRNLFGVKKGSQEDAAIKKVRQVARKAKPKKYS